MANPPVTSVQNLLPVQAYFDINGNFQTFIGQGKPFYAIPDPDQSGLHITNSTIDSSVIGGTTPAVGYFTSGYVSIAPTTATGIANKQYVDYYAAGLSWKQPVKAASLSNIASLSGFQTIDTVSLTDGDRVLVKDQSLSKNNGIYVVRSGAWEYAVGADNWEEYVGAIVFVEEGSQAYSAWYSLAQEGGTLGVTALDWANFSVSSTYSAGTGLTLLAGVFSITNTGVINATYGSATSSPVIAVNAQGQITSASNATITPAVGSITGLGTGVATALAVNIGSSGSVLVNGGALGTPTSGDFSSGTFTWPTFNQNTTGTAAGLSATLAIASGGTGQTTASAAFNALSPITTTGDLIIGNGTNSATRLAIGANNTVLTSNGSTASWVAGTSFMVYPGAGIPNSTGSAWGTSYSTTGSGTVVALATNPTLYNPNIDVIDFNTGYATALTAGQLGWDSTNNSLGYGMIGGNIIQHIGEDQYLYIKASATITKGQVIMFTGSVGASGVLTGAPATGLTDGTYIMGVAAESIANNAFGFVQTFGVLNNVNTASFSDGDILWYDPSVTGGLTATKPSAPNIKAQVAACNKGGSAGGGVITVRVNAGSALGGTDSNVQLSSPTGGQILSYNQTGQYWSNINLTAGTGISITPTTGGAITIASSVTGGLTIADDTTTNATRYLTFTSATSGSITGENVSSTKLQFNPFTGTFTTVDAVFSGTTAITLPVGTTAQRPGTPTNGMLRLNSTLNAMEVYSSTLSDWEVISYFTKPGAPTIGTATAASSTSATVTYTAPVSNGGSTITSYTAVANPGGQTGTVSQSGSGTITVSGLTSGVSYTFTVYATNAAGNSASSSASNSITTWTVPGAPTIGTATATGSSTATVSYTAPGNNGGTAITSYTAVSSPGGITATLSQAGSGTITVTGLSASTSYTFTVYATNAVGNSASSSASNSITTLSATYSADMLVVAGGGGGGGGAHGGGGGAGGFRTSTQNLTAGSVYTVTVGGAGSAGGGSPSGPRGGYGGDSTISGSGITTITSTGGGGGGGQGVVSGNNGGSGGGGGNNPGSGSGGSGNTPSTSPSQGNNGGAGNYGGAPYPAGGGGGAGAVGQTASAGGDGGNGGNGTASSITGSSVTYAGGGGGSTYNSGTPGTGGSGGGGNGNKGGSNGFAGTTNLGGGGGGGGGPGDNSYGGAGGSGVVILSVPTSRYTGTTTGSPTVTTSGSNTIMKFTGSGSYTA